jgi:hypothetical protein
MLVGRTARRLLSSRRPPAPLGFALDIDGVLLRGKTPIPGAADALNLLHKHDVPYVLMTNGGGSLEREKAESVTKYGTLCTAVCLQQRLRRQAGGAVIVDTAQAAIGGRPTAFAPTTPAQRLSFCRCDASCRNSCWCLGLARRGGGRADKTVMHGAWRSLV